MLLQSTVKKSFFDHCVDNLNYGFDHYKDFLFGLLLGMFIAWLYHRFLGNRNLRKSYQMLVDAKQETIDALKIVVADRLENVTVDKKEKEFFRRIQKFFRKNNK